MQDSKPESSKVRVKKDNLVYDIIKVVQNLSIYSRDCLVQGVNTPVRERVASERDKGSNEVNEIVGDNLVICSNSQVNSALDFLVLVGVLTNTVNSTKVIN